jgi:low temperature requirement protein LtrA
MGLAQRTGRGGGVSEAQLPRILRKRGEPDYPLFVELFFDLAYIFPFLRLTERLGADQSLLALEQTTVLLLALWWVWVLTVWLTDLFNPRLPVIQNLVITSAVGVIVMTSAMPYAYHGRGLVFVLAFYAIHLARDAVLIPGTRANRDIQARNIRVSFWLGISAVPWLAGAFTGSLARLLLWALAVAIIYGSARVGWPTPGLGWTNLGSRAFTALHLAERHRQIVVVALGELILTSSTGLAFSAPTALRIAVFALSIGGAVLLFQLYSEQVRSLEQPEAAARVEVVRPGTFASYWHLMIVAGVVYISTGARISAEDPVARASLTRTLTILAGPALFLFGTCMFDWSATGRLPWVRAVGALAALAATPAVYPLPVWMIMLAVDAILLLTWVVEVLTRKFAFSTPIHRLRSR